MGLDVSAFEKVELVERISLAEMRRRRWDHPLVDEDDVFFAYVIDERWTSKGLPEGFYLGSGRGYGFSSSYGGYNRFRDLLAKLVGTSCNRVWRGHASEAFGELIDFADNEGTLNGATCAKLARDFETWHERLQPFVAELDKRGDAEGNWFLGCYVDWQRAFDVARNGGAVRFS